MHERSSFAGSDEEAGSPPELKGKDMRYRKLAMAAVATVMATGIAVGVSAPASASLNILGDNDRHRSSHNSWNDGHHSSHDNWKDRWHKNCDRHHSSHDNWKDRHHRSYDRNNYNDDGLNLDLDLSLNL